jgi:[acyl-carrier-protein] S-malonyltransferase
MRKTAVLFAGQGAQSIGMGRDFYEGSIVARQIYDTAWHILGYDVKRVCFEQNDHINHTQYTQPSILVTSLAIYYTLMEHMDINVDAFLGFSLGEYSALHACGIFDLETIISLIQKRANYMAQASLKTKGSMAAVIGLERDVLRSICEEVTKDAGLVQVANYNSSNQLVISGESDAVAIACEKAKARGAKRAVVLNVSGGFHTPLMSEAADKMLQEIRNTKFATPKVDIIMNCDAKILSNIKELPIKMSNQIKGPVYFEDSIKHLIELGFDTFIEIGPGQVLSGLVRKIDGNKAVISIDKMADIDKLKLILGGENNGTNE